MKISVAYIKGPRGLRGELAAVLYKPSSQSLKKGLKVSLEKGEISREFEIESIRRFQKTMGIKLRGIDDRESAEYWKGADLLVEKDELERLGESEFYHFELEGLEVYDRDNRLIGTVQSVDNGVSNDILVVQSENGQVLIPFVRAFIAEVNIEKKRIVIEKLEGLY